MNLFHRAVAGLTRLGLSVWGTRVLSVRGRKSGELRSTPVNLLEHERAEYLVAPRGQTQWVRNLRAAGTGTLRVGRKIESFTAIELADDDKAPVLRSYLRRWKWEVNVFFDGVTAESPEEELRRVAHAYPVFRLEAAGA